jgi:hypothetical protein
MSFIDRLVLWLHIAVAVFTIGPVSVAIMSTPRYIRARNLTVVRYLYRTTRIFALISLGVAIFGVILAQQLHDLAKPWLTAALTLFVVAVVLLLIIIRDQRKSISALEVAEAADGAAAAAVVAGSAGGGPGAQTAGGGSEPGGVQAAQDTSPEALDDAHAAGQPEPAQPGSPGAAARQVATVERGRITTTGAVVSVIWLVILVLMVWHYAPGPGPGGGGRGRVARAVLAQGRPSPGPS